MVTLSYTLDMYPRAVPVVVHLNQYDSDFELVFTLMTSCGTFNIQPGTTAEIRGTKSDGNGYSANCTIDIANSKVTVAGHNQMTAASGKNTYELVLKKNDKVLSTANFILWVEPAAMDAGTITSDTVLKELNAIIESASIATEAAEDASDAADRAEAAAETLEIDATLTHAGQAADAKKAGDEISDLKSALRAFVNFFKHLNGTFDDGNGDQYIQEILDAIDVDPPIPPEPIVPLTFCPTPFSSSSTNLYSDNGVTKKTDLKSSGGIYYYLSDVVDEETIYHVTTTINTSINSHQYKAVYEYSAELISGAGTGNPTIYNITNLESSGIVDAQQHPLTSDFVYETNMTVQAGRQLAVLFYRNQSTAISSITAQKVVN